MSADIRFVFSRNLHSSGRRAVHLADAVADRALCGVLAGDKADGMPLTCGTCRASAAYSGRDTGPERVRIRVGAAEAKILCAHDPGLVRVIRAAGHGAWWDPRDKSWAIAAEDSADIAAALAVAGFEVTTTDDGPAPADAMIIGFEIPDGLSFRRSRTRAGVRDAASRFVVIDAPGERTGPPGKWHVTCGLADRLAAAGGPHVGPTACGRYLPAPAEAAAGAPPPAEVCLLCLRSVRGGWRGEPVDWVAVYAANAAAACRYPGGLPPERRAASRLLQELCGQFGVPGQTADGVAGCLASGAELGCLWLDMSDASRAALMGDAQLADVSDLVAWLGCLDPAGQRELAALLVTFELAETAEDPALSTGVIERATDLLTQALRLWLLGAEGAQRAAAADLAAERKELARALAPLPEDERVPDAILQAMTWSILGCTTAAEVARRLDDPGLLAGIYQHLNRLTPAELADFGIATARDLAGWITEARREPGDNVAGLDHALAAWALSAAAGTSGE